MTHRRSRIGRLLAALFIRGDEAPFLLRDLDDSFSLDVARGLRPAEVRRRDLRNILASAGSIWAEALRPSAWRPSSLCYWRDTVHEHATAGDYLLWRTSLRSFAALAAYRSTAVNVDWAARVCRSPASKQRPRRSICCTRPRRWAASCAPRTRRREPPMSS